MDKFPKFTLAGYGELLDALISMGSQFSSMSKIGGSRSGDVFLRHDLDISLELSLPMARLEREKGVVSTYYVLLSGLYNPFSTSSVSAMREILKLGHAIGLHYDLSLYPDDIDAAHVRLAKEVSLLAEVSGAVVDSIVMHEPYRGHVDFFECSDIFLNPSYFQKNDSTLMYVSDSCRAWRDDSLLRYLRRDSSCDKLLLNVHPELWLAEHSQHRLTYLEQTLLPFLVEPTREYYLRKTKSVWETHVGPVNGYGDDDE